MTILLIVAVVALLIGLYLVFKGVPWFKGFGVGCLLFAALGLSAAIPLLIRDASRVPQLFEQVKSDQNGAIVFESDRIAAVLGRYWQYRLAYAFLFVIAAGLVTLTRSDFAHGIAVGLALVACAGLLIDYVSENRAKAYQVQLQLPQHRSP